MSKKSEKNGTESNICTRPHAKVFTQPTQARGSFKDECDVDRIVKTYQRTGQITHVAKVQPQYGEAPEMSFFEAALIKTEISSQQEEANLAPPQEPSEAPESPESELAQLDESSPEKGAEKASEPVDTGAENRP